MVIAGIPFTMPVVWIGLIVIFLVIEGLTAGLVTIWFAVGALAALIAAMFHAPLWLQLVWFFVISIAAFAVTRPLVKKYINGRTQPTNADMLIGQECLVTEDIDNLTGHGAMTVGGKVWTARAQGDIAIAAGTTATVLRIEGVKLIVTPVCVRADANESGGTSMQFVIYGIIVIALVILVRNIRIVPQAQAYVITRLGAYKTTWGVGLHLKVPFIEAVAKRLSLKEQVADFPPQPVITKDNVTMQIDTVVYYQITDPKLYTYGIEQPILAIENLSATTLRNLIGDLELDQCLTSRDIVNTKMRQILDEATDPWGIKVNRVELKNILPPKEIQNAMEKQMKAERERREAILRAEGEKRSAILMAEGEKESAVLRADAKKQEQILEAQGRAEAILTVQRATAEGIRLINESMPSDAVIKLKSLEAFAAAADGRATKIIIPSEIQGAAALAAGLVESVKGDAPNA